MITGALSKEPRPEWSQSNAIALEAAQEGIGHVIAIYSSEIADEEARPFPDLSRIDDLLALQSKLFSARKALRIENQIEIQEVRQQCGAIVREWNDKQNRAAAE